MKLKKYYLITIIVALILVVGGTFLLRYKNKLKHETVTSFQDPSGWFYVCSQPIPAKWAMVPHLNGKYSRQLVAANSQDVSQYCQKNGIE